MKQLIQQQLNDMLQHDVQLNCNNKTVKQGRLINYTCDDYVVTLILRNARDQLKSYDMYYPYDMSTHADGVTFDYRVATLVAERDDMHQTISRYSRDNKTHKMYDQQVHLVRAG